MAENFSLGNKGKFGNLDFTKLKSGVTKKDLGIEGNSLLSTIFDQVNTKKASNGEEEKLDRSELQVLMQTIKALAGDDNKLTNGEAKKFKLSGENIGKEKDALLEFLAKLSDLTKGIEKVEQKADAKSEVITYEDGHTEEVFQDGSKIITVTNGNKTVKTKQDKDGNVTEETVIEGDEKETVTEFVGGKKSKVTVNDKANKTVTTTQFNGDRKTKETVESESETTVVEYDEAEQPKTKTVTNAESNEVSKYEYQNGEYVLKQRTIPDNNEVVTYNGTRQTSVVDNDGVKTTTVFDNGTLQSQKEVRTLENGKQQIVETVYNGNNWTEETSVDGLPTSQRKSVNGQEYSVEYVPVDKKISEDGVGVKVIVQNGESIAMLAKRFGCSMADIIALNPGAVKGKHPNAYFLVGQEIIIPGKLEADHPELINRKSAAEANADYEAFIRRRDAERAAEAERQAEEARAAEEARQAEEIKAGEKEMQEASAATIVAELLAETKGVNSKKNIRAILSRIDNPTELAEVNRLLAAAGYEADDLYSSIEKFINKELQRVETDFTCEDLESFVQRMIDNDIIKGQEAIDAQARMAARVIFDAGDGFGTDCDETKRGIYLIKAPKGNDPAAAKAVYDKVNDIVKEHRTFYGLGTPCDNLKDYLEGEIWTKEIEYLDGILAENNAIQGKEKENAIYTLFMRAVDGAGTDIEKLTQAIKAITSQEDRIALEKALVQYCKDNGIKARIPGQSALQAILYSECDKNMGISRNYDEIRKFNDMLIKQGAYSEQDAVKVKAEQVAIQMLEGDYNNILDAVKHVDDKQVLAKVDELLKTKGYKGLNDFLSQKLNSEKANLAKAELAGKNLLSNEAAVKVAVELLQKSDFDSRAKGLMAIRNEEVAKAVDAELQKKGISLAEIVEQFNKEKSNYKLAAKVFDFLGAEKFSDDLRANTDASDNMYVEASNPQQVSEEQKAAYDAAISALEKDYNDAMEAYKKAREDQGAFSSFVDSVADRLNLGTTRDEIEASLEHNKETIRLLKLAAEGKLAKMENGKAVSVSFESVFNERTNVTFDTAKTEKVANQGMRMLMMSQIKDFVAVCWRDLESGQNSGDVKQLSLGIYNAVKNTGKNIEEFGFKLNSDGVLVKPDGTVATVDELQALAKQIKELLAVFTNEVLGENVISADADSAAVTKAMDKAYEKNIKAFKEEYEAAFGTKPTDAMVESYLKTINTGKMVGTIAVSIAAVIAAPFTGGASLAAATGMSAASATAIVAGLNTAAATMGLNALENSTDADGYTNSELTADLENAIMTGITAAIGVKVGAVADDIAANAGKIAKHLKAYGFEVSADAITSFAETYIQHGEFNTQEFVKAMAISLVANGVGRAISTKGAKGSDDVDAGSGVQESTRQKLNGPVESRDAVADGEVARNADASHLNANERKMLEEGLDDTPTPEQLKAYQEDIAYKKPTPEEQAAIDKNNAEADAASAEARRIENNAKIEQLEKQVKKAKQEIDKLNDDIKDLDNKIADVNKRIENAKKMGKNTERLEAQLKNFQDTKAVKLLEIKKLEEAATKAAKEADEAAKPAGKTDEPAGTGTGKKTGESEEVGSGKKADEAGKTDKADHSVNKSKYFSNNDVAEFMRRTPSTPYEAVVMLRNMGCVPDAADAAGRGFVSYVNKKTGMQYQYVFKDGKLTSQLQTKIKIGLDGKYTRLSSVRIDNAASGARNITIEDGGNLVYKKTVHPDDVDSGAGKKAGEAGGAKADDVVSPSKFAELKAKMGETLANAWVSIKKEIDNLTNPAQFKSLKEKITTTFANFKAEMNELLDSLREKIKSLRNKAAKGVDDAGRAADGTGTGKKAGEAGGTKAADDVDSGAGKKVGEAGGAKADDAVSPSKFAELKAKMGETLANAWVSIKKEIDNLTNPAQFKSLKEKITTTFANFKAEMRELMDSLREKIKSLRNKATKGVDDAGRAADGTGTGKKAGEAGGTKAADDAARKTSRPEDLPENRTYLDRATQNGNNFDDVAPRRTVGKLNDEHFAQIQKDLDYKMSKISSPNDPRLDRIQRQIDALQNREQRRYMQNLFDEKKANLAKNADTSLGKVDASETSQPPHTSNSSDSVVRTTEPLNNDYFGLSNDFSYGGWVKNKGTQTSFVPSKDNVYIAADYTGHSVLAGKRVDGVNTDVVRLAYDADKYSVYDPKNDVTLIGFGHNDAFGRFGSYNICIKGKVSEADAAGLLEHLKSKGLLPKIDFRNSDLRPAQQEAEAIQQAVVDYFKNLV